MRTGKLAAIGFAMIVATLAFAGCSSQRKAARSPAEIAQLKETVESGSYRINVDTAYPASGRSIPVTGAYSLAINNGRVDSNLPYFGRAYSLPYGGGEGLIFNAEITGYRLTYGKNGEANISFDARTNEDTYNFIIDIFPGGMSNITIKPGNRQVINFSGNLHTSK